MASEIYTEQNFVTLSFLIFDEKTNLSILNPINIKNQYHGVLGFWGFGVLITH